MLMTHSVDATPISRHTGHIWKSIPIALFLTFSAQSLSYAGISGINTPVTSSASINFDDTNSVAPPAGVTNTGPSVSPWNGTTLTLPGTTDPNTGDFATGNLQATFVPAGNTYAINLSGITLTQAPGNTGFANLSFNFTVEYQLDALGLPSQATLYPNFLVNGTVQSTAGSFALVSGFIDYYGVNTAGTIGLIETVNYNSLWNTPGPFSGTAFGIPTIGTTPALVGNTTLTLNGSIHFMVDPATINVESLMVPEPGTCTLFTLGLIGLAIAKRVRRF